MKILALLALLTLTSFAQEGANFSFFNSQVENIAKEHSEDFLKNVHSRLEARKHATKLFSEEFGELELPCLTMLVAPHLKKLASELSENDIIEEIFNEEAVTHFSYLYLVKTGKMNGCQTLEFVDELYKKEAREKYFELDSKSME